MARHHLLAFTNPAKGQEGEFERWYDERHVPDMLSVPGVVAARRYRLSDATGKGEPGWGYLAFYELDTDDPDTLMAEVRARIASGAIPRSDALAPMAGAGVPNGLLAEALGRTVRARSPVQDKVSPEEWQARVDLAACCRLVDFYGMTDLLGNNVTARVPGEPDRFLINPLGLLYDEVTASSVVKIDLEGRVVSDPAPKEGVNQAGFVIHGAMHRARADVNCVIHTHTPAGMALSALESGIMPVVQSAMRFGRVAYHDFTGLSLDVAEQEGLMRNLGDADVMILRNHGLLAMGNSIPAAFDAIYRLELVAKVQLQALACNAKLRMPDKAIVEEVQAIYRSHVIPRAGLLEWPALLRKLDRIDPSYRD